MNAARASQRWRHALRNRTRDQRGMTMIETMLAVTISTLLALPMLGWAALAFQQQVETQDRNVDGTSLGLLRSYFFSDVASAQSAVVAGDRLGNCGRELADGPATLVLADGDARTAYLLAPGDEGTTSFWRVRCAGPDAPADNRVELVEDVLPAGTEATCTPLDGRADDRCHQVTLRVATDQFQQAVLTTSLRATSAGAELLEVPVAAISALPTSGPRRLTVQFSSAGSTDPQGSELSFNWDFGDGNRGLGPEPVHSFERVGTHVITLVVTNEFDVSSEASVEIEVLDNAPVAVISAPAPDAVTHRGDAVQFSSLGSNDDLDAEWGGRIVSYAWDFGDGTASTEPDPVKVYEQLSPPEGFIVRLVVTDDAGQTATAQRTLAVTNRAPKVLIFANPERGTSPLVVDFAALVEDEPGMANPPALTYLWDFSDGATSTEAQPPPVTYTGAGARTVTLTVVDDAGASTVATITVTVDDAGIGPPTNLRQTRSGNERGRRFIEMAWDRVEGANRYEVFLQCESCDETASGSESGTTVRIRGLSPGRKHYLASVRAQDAATGVWGPWSAQVRVRS